MITLAKPVATEDVVEAIQILCSPVFGTLNALNALGGVQTDVWRLVREFTLGQLIDEAVRRDVDLSETKATLCDVLLYDTPPFRGAIGYDGRRRCPLCGRRHFRPNDGSELSCGDARRFVNPPRWQWTRALAEAAFEGRYTPGEYRP